MNVEDKMVKDAYGSIINRGKGLFIFKESKDKLPLGLNGFRLRVSSNKRVYIIESYYVDFERISPVLITRDGEIILKSSLKRIKSLYDLNGLYDGTSKVSIEGNTLYTSKPKTFIGLKGQNVRLLSKYLGRVNIKQIKD